MAAPNEPPVRQCIGCRQRRAQGELVRCALVDGVAGVARTAPGRGAWVCGLACAQRAQRNRAFERAWRAPVPDGAIELLLAELAARDSA